jgi:hypothetical protein
MKGRDSDIRGSLGISGVGISGILVAASSDMRRAVVVLETGAMKAWAEPREARMTAEENFIFVFVVFKFVMCLSLFYGLL